MESNNKSIDQEIQYIIDAYEYLMRGIDKKAIAEKTRAYGGIIRAGKGKLVESVAENLIEIAWDGLGGRTERLTFAHKVFFPIRKEYIDQIKNPDVKKHMFDNIDSYYYGFKPDVQVCIDDKFIMGIECKSYTENAMFKRILVDFTLLKFKYPKLDCALLQLESQLGGDYASLNDIVLGSPSTHTLLSYFNIDLHIITLLKGERKVDKPIHKTEFYKPLTKKALDKAIIDFKELLKKYR
jgi:hypothetical protein